MHSKNKTRDQSESPRMQRSQTIPMELCVSGGAVNVEIPKRKSRKRSGELGQRALRSITGTRGARRAKLDAPYQRKRAGSLLLTANAPHAEHRKGICGSSCYALSEICSDLPPWASARSSRPRAAHPDGLLQPRSSVAASHPKASFSLEPLSPTIRRSWNLYVPIPRRSYKLAPFRTKLHRSIQPHRRSRDVWVILVLLTSMIKRGLNDHDRDCDERKEYIIELLGNKDFHVTF